jgi:hypothetical protein
MLKMKTIYSIVCLAACFLFVGCFEVEETTAFKTADSGDYSISVDMGKMIAQLKMFGGAEKLNDLKEKDSIAYFKDILQHDSLLSKEEKDVLQDGYMKMLFNEEKEEMKVVMAAPFKSLAQLSIMRNTLFKMVTSKTKAGLPSMDNLPGGAGSLSMLDINSLGFSLKTEKGLISNTLNAEKLKQNLEGDSLMQQIKQMAPLMGSSVTYKTVYSFPKPVKDLKATKGTISDDKKTIIIKNDFTDLFDKPAAFEYSISY